MTFMNIKPPRNLNSYWHWESIYDIIIDKDIEEINAYIINVEQIEDPL